MHDESLDRVCPRRVVFVVAEEREGADHPTPDLIGASGVTGGERPAEREVHVRGEAAARHRRLPFGGGLRDRFGALVLLEQVLRLAVGRGVVRHARGAQDLAPCDRHDGLGRDAGRRVEQGHIDAAIDRGAGLPGGELLLRDLVGKQHRHAGALRQESCRVEDRASGGDLVARQRIMRVRCGDLLDRDGLRCVVGHHRPHYFRATAQ